MMLRLVGGAGRRGRISTLFMSTSPNSGSDSNSDSSLLIFLQGTLASVTDTYNIGVPPINRLPWVTQLITCMTRPEGCHLNNLITQLSKFFPQAMYYPLRTLIQSLRMEAQIKYKTILQKTSYAPPSHDAVLQASPVLMSV